jgi:hypothetical protein
VSAQYRHRLDRACLNPGAWRGTVGFDAEEGLFHCRQPKLGKCPQCSRLKTSKAGSESAHRPMLNVDQLPRPTGRDMAASRPEANGPLLSFKPFKSPDGPPASRGHVSRDPAALAPNYNSAVLVMNRVAADAGVSREVVIALLGDTGDHRQSRDTQALPMQVGVPVGQGAWASR